MSEETFYLKIEEAPERFQTWLGGISISSVYYKQYLSDPKAYLRYSDIRLRKSQSTDGGFIYYLIFAECSVISPVPPPKYFEVRPEEILFGFIKFKVIGEKYLYLVGCRHDEKWLEVDERLFELIKSEYRPGEPNLKIGDDKKVVIEELKKSETAGVISHKESGHYSYPLEKRREIVREYRQDRNKSEFKTMEAWVSKWSISTKTLTNYLKEFPEEE